jgi:TonB family protein
MAIHDLTLQSVEHYGGIDLKKFAKQYLSSALALSILLHLAVLSAWLGWSWFRIGDNLFSPRDLGGPRVTFCPMLEPGSRPSGPFSTATHPSGLTVPPDKFAIPIPVLDHSGIIQSLPEQSTIVSSNNPGDTGHQTGNPYGLQNGHGHGSQVQARPDTIPLPEQFIPIDEGYDPRPIQNLQQLVQYPDLARRSGLEGKVLLGLLIGLDGRVEAVDIDKSSGYQVLDNSAADAMRNARFTPALQDGHPVRVWYEAPIEFRMR